MALKDMRYVGEELRRDSSGGFVDTLEVFHAKLSEHFEALAASREKLQYAAPVFALEHGLSNIERDEIAVAVRTATAHGLTARERTAYWLPFVVYAAESGYAYEGSEYWRTFGKMTPGWTDDDHDWVSIWFRRFAKQFAGAVPSGAFADAFRIISWPITHSVLPVYLQRQLVELLFLCRAELTPRLLNDPAELGAHLAVRSVKYSERFRIFCQNGALVGQVSSALLTDSGGESPYLLSSTLDRIVQSLNQEQDSRAWLLSARDAVAVATRRPSSEQLNVRPTRPTVHPLRMFLRRSPDWHLHVELPTLTNFADAVPGLTEVLRTSRARVNGTAKPVPPTRLLHHGQTLRLDSLPILDQPFIRLDKADEAMNDALAEKYPVSAGPNRIFKLQGEEIAFEIRSRTLRAGGKYILLEPAGRRPNLPWIVPARSGVHGAVAYRMEVPTRVEDADRVALEQYGLLLRTHVQVRPVGLNAIGWDGESEATWLVGELALIGVRADLVPDACVISVGAEVERISWPVGESEIVLRLVDLPVGVHQLSVRLEGTAEGSALEAAMTAVIISTSAGQDGRGIRMLAAPANSKLQDLWNGLASITIDGPADVTATLTVAFVAADGTSLASYQQNVVLPVDEKHWKRIARAVREDKRLGSAYDDAEAGIVSISRQSVGFASIRCERGFEPLRWRLLRGHRDAAITAQVIDQTDAGGVEVTIYDADEPVAPRRTHETTVVVPPRGALAVASVGTISTSMVLPGDPNSALQRRPPHPRFPARERSVQGLTRLIDADRRWADAALPGDLFAAYVQHRVRVAIASEVACTIGRGRWASLERKVGYSDAGELLDDLAGAVGSAPLYQQLTNTISKSLYRWDSPGAVLEGFASAAKRALSRAGLEGRPSAARYLLTLAGRPALTASFDRGDAIAILNALLDRPELFHAARYTVLATRAMAEPTIIDDGF